MPKSLFKKTSCTIIWILFSLSLFIIGCTNSTSTTSNTTATVQLNTILIDPIDSTIPLGATGQFTAMGVYSNGTTLDMTQLVLWQSSDLNVATISNTPGSQGIASSVAAGSAVISATFNGILAIANLNVVSLKSITVTPANPILTTIGATQQFTATGTYSDGSPQDLTTLVTWSSSNTNATINSSGLATAVAAGMTTITATANSISGDATLTINIAPVNHYVYAVNCGTDTGNSTISLYSMNTSGVLSPLTTDPFILTGGVCPYGIAISPLGNYVYVVNSTNSVSSNGGSISILQTNNATGILTFNLPLVLTDSNPFRIAITPSGNYAYVVGVIDGNTNTGNILMYSINSTTGALTQLIGSPILTGDASPIGGMAITPSGNFAYVVNSASVQSSGTSDGSIAMFSINSLGQLITLNNSPYSLNIYTPTGIAITPAGNFAYVINDGNGTTVTSNISMYSINTSSGQLNPLFPATIATGASPSAIAIHPAGTYAYVINQGSIADINGTVSMYRIDASSGQLTSLSPATVATGDNPTGMAIDSSGSYLYVTNTLDSTISMYSIDASSGQLTPLALPIMTGGNPYGIISW